MSESILRIWEEQDRLRRLADPFGDIRRQADAFRQLGIGSATMEFLRQGEERRRLLASFSAVDTGAIAQMASDFERHRKLLDGPIEEARRLGLLDPDSDIRKSFAAAMEARETYEKLFRRPDFDELGHLAREAMNTSRIAREFLAASDPLRLAMGQIQAPWLSIAEEMRSARAMADIVGIGETGALPVPVKPDAASAQAAFQQKLEEARQIGRERKRRQRAAKRTVAPAVSGRVGQ